MRLGFALLALLSASPAAATRLTDAQSLYDRNQVAEAQKAFAAVAADESSSPDDSSAAERQLALIAWMIDADADRALQHLVRAETSGGDRCATSTLVARILRRSGRSNLALDRGPALLASCETEEGKDAIRTHLIGARLDRAMTEPNRRRALLAEAAKEGAALSDRSEVEGARVRLETAVLTGDAAAALTAWKDYFWLDEADAPQALADLSAADRFTKGLAAAATTADRLRLAEMLMRAGFGEQAWRYAGVHGLAERAGGDPVWRKLEAYHRATNAVRDVELKLNRGLVRGKKDDAALENAAKAATIDLMKAAGASGDPRSALREHYGLLGTVGKTSGYPSIHMGHVIEDHSDKVTQYGRSADVRFIVLDNMIGNGFESWLWDGSAMVGGWTADGMIVHVRPGYVRSPMQAWRLTQNGPTRRRLIARQATRAAADIAALKSRPIATQEGLNDRLQMQLVDQIWSAARSKAKTGDEAKRLFLAEYSRANLDQSIRVHEGRHAIDNAMGLKDNVDQAVLEYQAKLAELALTAYPRMALGNMNRNLEGDGPHDRGGARLFAGFKAWMEANKDQIMGYDPNLPILAQIDRLTDGQIAEVATDLDPLAKRPTIASDDNRF